MKLRSCLGNTIYLLLLVLGFGVSSYSWFKFFVRGKSIPTPALVGKTIADARAITSDLGILIVVDNSRDQYSEGIPPGAVVWQNRAPNSLIKRGTRLWVGQSLGPLVLQVPNLTGESPRTAMLRFSQRNLKVGDLSYVETAGPPGIISEDPPRGTVVKGGTAVSLLVGFSAPPSAFVMPDLIDLPLAVVRPTLEARGFHMPNVKYESYPGISDGIIIRQFPLPGSPVSARDPIIVVVSQQEESAIVEQQEGSEVEPGAEPGAPGDPNAPPPPKPDGR